MRDTYKIHPLTGADEEELDFDVIGGWWVKETAGSTAELKLIRDRLNDPTTAPSAALKDPAAAGNVDDGTHSYKLTEITAAGETEPTAKSNVVTVANKAVNGKITVTLPTKSSSAVTAFGLYRTVAGDAGAWKLVANDISPDAATYLDNVADGSLGANAPSSNTTGTVLFDVPLTANQADSGPKLDRPIDIEGVLSVEVVSGAVTGALFYL